MCTVEACSTCPIIRTEMFSRINNICQNFHVLNPEQKLYWLLNNENEEILASICNLIKQSTIQLNNCSFTLCTG